jgi:hypothetical protein
MNAIIFAADLARHLGVSEDDVYELARTKQLPFAVSTGHPRRLFIAERDADIWRRAVKERAT